MSSALLPRRPDASHRFANTYEMAGHYARRMLELIQDSNKAPAQIGFLNHAAETVEPAVQYLQSLESYNRVYDFLQENTTASTGFCLVTLNSRLPRRAKGLLIRLHDFIDDIEVDMVLPYSYAGHGPLLVGDPEIMELHGVASSEERELAMLGVLLDFGVGLSTPVHA